MIVKLFCYINSPTVYSKTIFCNESAFSLEKVQKPFLPANISSDQFSLGMVI